MNYLDLSWGHAAENVAYDERLLEWCEAGEGQPLLRFWEAHELFIVVGYSQQIDREVNEQACAQDAIPILRRCSGGGTVVQGPGCLNYALVLPLDWDPALQSISGTNSFILQRHLRALAPLVTGSLDHRGCTDLTLDGRKFSGNAQRRKRTHLLFHGSFLIDLKIELIERYLKIPSRQPDYRAARSHAEFLTHFPASREAIKEALRNVWAARQPLTGPTRLDRTVDAR